MISFFVKFVIYAFLLFLITAVLWTALVGPLPQLEEIKTIIYTLF